MTDLELYNRKQEFIGFLKSIVSDVNYSIKRSHGTWTTNAITAAEELMGALDYYRDELTYWRDTLQAGLDSRDEMVYDEYQMEEEVA